MHVNSFPKIISFLLVCLMAACQSNNGEEPSIVTQLPLSSRKFEMGTAAIPSQPLTTEGWTEAFDTLEAHSDFILHHVKIDWELFQNSVFEGSTPAFEHLNFISAMANQRGLKLFIVIDPLSSDRTAIDPALPIGQDFHTERVRTALKNCALRVVRDYQPAYLGIFSEINTYLKSHANEISAVISLIEETRELVRTNSPSTIITTTFQFELLNGKVDGTPQWAVLQDIEPKLDVIGISTYPSPWFVSPAEIPDDYYEVLRTYSSKAIIVAESGWPSAGNSEFHGSEQNQDHFLVRFLQLTSNLDLQLWIWWFFHDWEGQGYPEYFKSMGLKKADGADKAAWKTWQKIHELPKD